MYGSCKVRVDSAIYFMKEDGAAAVLFLVASAK